MLVKSADFDEMLFPLDAYEESSMMGNSIRPFLAVY